jgi:hypothetical protein
VKETDILLTNLGVVCKNALERETRTSGKKMGAILLSYADSAASMSPLSDSGVAVGA